MPPATEYPTPPTLPPQWRYSGADITTLVDQAIHSTDQLLAKVVAEKVKTFESVVRPLAIHNAEVEKRTEPAIFMQFVATEKEVRDAAVEGDKKMQVSDPAVRVGRRSAGASLNLRAPSSAIMHPWQDHQLTSLTRLDVFEALVAAQEHTTASGITLTPEEQRLLDRAILDRTRNGLALEPSKREELLTIKKQIMRLEVDFAKNCNEEDGHLLFDKDELEGVPDLEGYAREGDKYKVTFKTPDIVPVLYVPALLLFLALQSC